MSMTGAYTDEAKRLRGEIKKKFKTQVALCQAIGAKDASYITAYVTGKNRIGNILREKLEAVGIDVNYILYGKKGAPELPAQGTLINFTFPSLFITLGTLQLM